MVGLTELVDQSLRTLRFLHDTLFIVLANGARIIPTPK